jgi:hypothetical protein
VSSQTPTDAIAPMAMTHEKLEAMLSRDSGHPLFPAVELAWRVARAAGHAAKDLVVAATYVEGPPFELWLGVKSHRGAAGALARTWIHDKRFPPIVRAAMRASEEEQLAAKFADLGALGVTSLATALVLADGTRTLQFGEGIFPSQIRGDA